MDSQQDSRNVKRMTLPSGRKIEVIRLEELDRLRHEAAAPAAGEPAGELEAHQNLSVCRSCDSELVNPIDWDEAGPEHWHVVLHCPNCDAQREGVFHQQTVETFDEELDRGLAALARDYRRLMRANMAEEIERFSRALAVGAILPEDF